MIVSGQVFGELQVIEKSIKASKKNQPFWRCACSCGEFADVRSDRLTSGKTKSCGHLFSNYVDNRPRKVENDALNSIYARYKHNAKKGNREFTLTSSQFKYLITQNCYYCNSEPSCHYTRTRDSIVYNGLDRAANTKGYTPENVVPCCDICNLGKRTKDFSVFTDWISRLAGFSLRGLISG